MQNRSQAPQYPSHNDWFHALAAGHHDGARQAETINVGIRTPVMQALPMITASMYRPR
jgi:hypothetical protein